MLFGNKEFYRTTRFKTTVWYAGLFLLLEIVSWTIVYFYLKNDLYKDLDEAISAQAQAIYNFVSESNVKLLNFEPDSVFTSREDFVFDLIFDAIVTNPRSAYIQVKMNNDLIFRTDNLKPHKISLKNNNGSSFNIVTFNDSLLSDHELRAAHLVKNNYDIIVAFPTVLIARTLTHFTDINGILGPLFLLLAVLGGALISFKSLSRIDLIIAKTKKITALNLNEEIPGSEYDDEYGRLVRTMNEMIYRIKKAIDYMNQFSIAASHELKTPLTILRGEIEVALKSPKPAEEYKRILQSNYEETLRLTNIVEKLFFLSKVDYSLIELKREEISAEDLIKPIINQMKPEAKKKNMEILFSAEGGLNFMVDIELMRRAISNLVENAIKYGDENSTITISAGHDHRLRQYISVTNKGNNIPRDLQEKIFDRFFRVESSRSRETGGLGLGLSVVKAIVEFHKGNVTVSSEKQRENIFSIYLSTNETDK